MTGNIDIAFPDPNRIRSTFSTSLGSASPLPLHWPSTMAQEERRAASASIAGVVAATALVCSRRAAGSLGAGMTRRGRGGNELSFGGGGAEEAEGCSAKLRWAGGGCEALIHSLALWPILLQLMHQTGSLHTSAQWRPARHRRHLPLRDSSTAERGRGERVVEFT